jgi:hypothetical protein
MYHAFGGKRNSSRNVVIKPKGKIPFGKSMRRSEDNIKKDFKEVEWENVGWIQPR